MKKKFNVNISAKMLLFVLTALCIILLIATLLFKNFSSTINNVCGTIVVPMQTGINRVGLWVSDKFEAFENVKDLIAENEQLKQELDEVKNENKSLQQDKYELENLRNLYKLDEKYPSYPKIGARIISSSGNNWFNTFVIDKGSDDGIDIDMNVLAGNGLVGIVTEVGSNYARVKSIVDDTSEVSAMILRTSDRCIVKGDLKLLSDGYIKVDFISKDADIKEGDTLVTSNISSKYLQGITIGTVSNIVINSDNYTKSAYVTPSVDFEHLEEVLVITELKQTVKD